MPMKRDKNLEYVTETGLWVKLYAPEGSIFNMPPGGDVMNMVAKGYLIHVNDEWREKSIEYEEAKAASLKISDEQREMKFRQVNLERKQDHVTLSEKMATHEADMEAAEDKITAAEAKMAEAAAAKALRPKAKAKVKPRAGK